jgi:hypothetical protein
MGVSRDEIEEGIAGAGNTSTIPLGSAATFMGDGEVNSVADVMVSCQTDFSLTASSSKDIPIGHLALDVKPTDKIAFAVTKQSGGSDGAVTIGCSWLERI